MTPGALYSAVAAGMQQNRDASRLVLHPDTWNGLLVQFNSEGEPLTAPPRVVPLPAAAVGEMHGIPVFLGTDVDPEGFQLQ